MPSQPDMDAFYRLHPDKRPPDLAPLLSEANGKVQMLETKLKEIGIDPEAVYRGEAVAVVAPVQTETVQVADGALFFASKEGVKYFPIAEREKSKVKPENIVYFRTEEEATAAGYLAAA